MPRIKQKKFRSLFCVKNVLLAFMAFFIITSPANADMLDKYNLAPFVPLVLKTMMNIATSLYNFFVNDGHGIIYTLVYTFLGFYLCLYLFKMHLPKDWLSFLGFSGGGEMWDGSATGWSMADNVLKPCIRALIAVILLLRIEPVFVTKWLVNPFLEFGSIYTESVLKTINSTHVDMPECPETIKNSRWLTDRSCNFLIQPVFIISQENNKVIKYGFNFLKQGLRGLLQLIPHGGRDIMNIITGILLLVAFISSNLFMALLIIQAIFDFCLSLIMYPFNVLVWVAKKSDTWINFLPAFEQIITSLKKLIITMIACAFILCVNIAIVRALFNWSSSVYNVAANGVAHSNLVANTGINFGQHSVLWLSAILTFFLMQNIFKLTRERLEMYTKDTPKTLYNDVSGDIKTAWNKTKAAPQTIKNWFGIGKKIIGKK